MSRLFMAGVCLLVAIFCANGVVAQRPPLSRDDQRTVKFVTRAYFAGQPFSYAEPLSRLLRKADDDRLAAIDEALIALRVPPAADLMTNAHLQAVQYGVQERLPTPSLREVLSVLDRLSLRVVAAQGGARRHRLMENPLPDPSTLDEYDTLIWEAHVLESKIRNAAVIGRHMRQLASGLSGTQVAALDEESRTFVRDAKDHVENDVRSLLAEVQERQAELRLQRLELALATLESPTLTTERFRAAYTSQVDTDVLTSFLTNAKERMVEFGRERLRTQNLIEQVAKDREYGRSLAGDLTEKSQLLFTGLHWWLRGRYGIGSDVFGLAKSPAAMYSSQAQMALYMPSEFPTPNDPEQVSGQQQRVPLYDRRHHYWWAWDDRRVRRSTQSSNETRQDGNDPGRVSYSVGTYFW